jgi:hypothetical protein
MGKLVETLTAAPRVRNLISLNIDSVGLTASAVMREGVVVDGKLIPTTGDTPITVPPEAAAAQLTMPIGDVAVAIGLTHEQLLAMSFSELMVAMFDPYSG